MGENLEGNSSEQFHEENRKNPILYEHPTKISASIVFLKKEKLKAEKELADFLNEFNKSENQIELQEKFNKMKRELVEINNQLAELNKSCSESIEAHSLL